MKPQVIWFNQLGINDVDTVGGKNASLGEMISHLSATDIKVPDGFATTAQTYRDFLAQQNLDEKIHRRLQALNQNPLSAGTISLMHCISMAGAVRHREHFSAV